MLGIHYRKVVLYDGPFRTPDVCWQHLFLGSCCTNQLSIAREMTMSCWLTFIVTKEPDPGETNKTTQLRVLKHGYQLVSAPNLMDSLVPSLPQNEWLCYPICFPSLKFFGYSYAHTPLTPCQAVTQISPSQ